MNETELRDLTALAVRRTERAINSVGQLLENDQQSVLMLTEVAGSLVATAAAVMHNSMRDSDTGERAPPLRDCELHVLATIGRALGITTRDMDNATRERTR